MSDYPYMEHYRLLLAVRDADVLDEDHPLNIEEWKTAEEALNAFEREHGPSPAIIEEGQT